MQAFACSLEWSFDFISGCSPNSKRLGNNGVIYKFGSGLLSKSKAGAETGLAFSLDEIKHQN